MRNISLRQFFGRYRQYLLAAAALPLPGRGIALLRAVARLGGLGGPALAQVAPRYRWAAPGRRQLPLGAALFFVQGILAGAGCWCVEPWAPGASLWLAAAAAAAAGPQLLELQARGLAGCPPFRPAPYLDVWHIQLEQRGARYARYCADAWSGWHELEQRVLLLTCLRVTIYGL